MCLFSCWWFRIFFSEKEGLVKLEKKMAKSVPRKTRLILQTNRNEITKWSRILAGVDSTLPAILPSTTFEPQRTKTHRRKKLGGVQWWSEPTKSLAIKKAIAYWGTTRRNPHISRMLCAYDSTTHFPPVMVNSRVILQRYHSRHIVNFWMKIDGGTNSFRRSV